MLQYRWWAGRCSWPPEPLACSPHGCARLETSDPRGSEPPTHGSGAYTGKKNEEITQQLINTLIMCATFQFHVSVLR